MKTLSIFTAVIIMAACNSSPIASPGDPLIGFDFNNGIINHGIFTVPITGQQNTFDPNGLSGKALDLSANSSFRKPVLVLLPSQYNIDDYEGVTVLAWVKKALDDDDQYCIAGHYFEMNRHSDKGWRLISTAEGGWAWQLSDGTRQWSYHPTHRQQPLSDGNWHQLGFSISKSLKEARFYFDGHQVAIVSIEGCDSLYQTSPLVIGGDPDDANRQTETFNGSIDEFSYWGRPLKNSEIAWLYQKMDVKRKKTTKGTNPSQLSVMTWNIKNGGDFTGKSAGLDRIAQIISESGCDVICLQETLGAGEKLAGRLGYQYYCRSQNLSVLSRIPIDETFNIFKPMHAGAIRIRTSNSRTALLCPVWLSNTPDIGTYVNSGQANIDTIIAREKMIRENEMRFILSEISTIASQNPNEPVVIAGNFNCGSHLDWTERNQSAKKGLIVAFPVSLMMEKSGYKDSYRILHSDEVQMPGNTWSPLYREVFQDRVDYIYYKGSSLSPISSTVINIHPQGFPSDHGAVMTTFQWN